MIPIRSNQLCKFVPAFVGDCVFNTFVGKRHTPVMPQIAGTVTTRPGELCVIVEAFQ